MSVVAGEATVSDRRARRQVRGFDRFVPQSPLVDRFGAGTADALRQEMHQDYLRLVPGVPHIGKGGTSDSRFLSYAPMALAVYRVMLRHGGSVEDAGHVLHECGRAMYQRVPTLNRPHTPRRPPCAAACGRTPTTALLAAPASFRPY